MIKVATYSSTEKMKQISELQEANHCKLRQTPQLVAPCIKTVSSVSEPAPFWGTEDLTNNPLANERNETSPRIQKIKLRS